MPSRSTRRLRAIAILPIAGYLAYLCCRLLALFVFSGAVRGSLFAGLISRGAAEGMLPVAAAARAFAESPLALGVVSTATALCIAYAIAREQAPARDRPPWRIAILLLALAAGALALDRRYGVTPLADLLPAPAPAGQRGVAEPMTLAQIVYYTGASPRVVTTGTLTYQPRMRRFELVDGEGTVPPVQLSVYDRPTLFGTSFDEMRGFGAQSADARPRLYRELAPHLGRRVQVIGSASNAAIHAHVSEVTAAESAQPGTPAIAGPSDARR